MFGTGHLCVEPSVVSSEVRICPPIPAAFPGCSSEPGTVLAHRDAEEQHPGDGAQEHPPAGRGVLVLPSVSHPAIDDAKMRFGEQEPVRGVTTWQGTRRWGELLLGATTHVLGGSQPQGAGGS